MILTGLSLFHQAFYPQSGFSYSFETEAMADMNLLFLGPTGYSGQFKFITGKVYDTSGNFFGSYNSGEPFKFDFSFYTGRYSTWINDNLYEANRLFSSYSYTGPPINYLTGFTLTGTSQGDINADITLNGTRPGLYFSPLYTNNLQNFSGFVRVTGYAASWYSIDPNNASGNLLTANAFNSGNYNITGNYFNSGSVISTDFLFDFGLHTEDLVVYYNPDTVQTGYLNMSSNGTASLSGLPYTQYEDFNITSVWNAPTNFETYLKFLYRSGYTPVYGSGIGTGRYAGFITGSGWLESSSVSGYVSSGYYHQFTGIVPTGFSPPIMMTGTGLVFAYATGQITYDFNLEVVGDEYILDPTVAENLKQVTGYIQGTITGIVGPGSGRYIFSNHQAIGRYVIFSGEYTVGNGLNRGFYDLIINPASYWVDTTGYHTGYVNYTGVLEAYMSNHLGTGMFTGQAPAALIYSTNSGLITGFNYLTGDYSNSTGSFSHINSSYYDYADNGFRINPYIRKSDPDAIGAGVYEIGSRVIYDRQIPWGVTDYVEITVQNDIHSISGIVEGYSL